MYIKPIVLLTKTYNEMDVITPQVEQIVKESGIQNGMVTVLTKHTTTGITVNEALECLESDIALFLQRQAPEDAPYSHARMLRDYGSTAGNPTGHLKAYLTGSMEEGQVEHETLTAVPWGDDLLVELSAECQEQIGRFVEIEKE